MGLYNISCISCGKPFLWHSSSLQICSKCVENAGGGFHSIDERVDEGMSIRHYVSFSKAKTKEDAIKFLISSGKNPESFDKFSE